MCPRPQPKGSTPLDESEAAAARRVGERLRAELEPLIRSLPKQFRAGAAMSRELGIDRSTCQRVLQATRDASDGIDVLVRLPGVEGLRLFSEALDERGTKKLLISQVNEALESFSELIERLAGSQAALVRRIQAIGLAAGGALTQETEAAFREQAFEALAPLTGRQLETQCNFILMRPLPGDPKRAQVIGARDMVGLTGAPGAPPVSGLFFARAHESLPEGQPRPVPLVTDGDQDSEEEGSTLLSEFCSQQMPKVSTRRVGDVTLELIEPPEPGSAPLDVALAYRLEPAILHPALQENRRLHLYYHCVVPTRRVLLHAYLHRSMAKRCLAEAFVHQRSVEALSDGPEPWFDRLDQRLVVEILGSDLGAAGTGASPRQERFLARLFQETDWSPSDFIGFRVRLDHPIWGCRYTLAFEFTDDSPEG